MPTKREPGVRTLARVGLLARGIVYFTVGILALMVASHTPGGRATDGRGAMREILHQPLGYILLGLIAIGVFCYAFWRALEAIHDYDGHGRGPLGFILRTGQLIGAVVYILLGAYAVNLIFLFSRSSTKASEQKIVRWLFGLPFGDWVVFAVGAIIVIFAVAQFFIAWFEAYTSYIAIPDRRSSLIMPICKYGLMARGLVFGLIGWFFINAAVKHSPREAGGFREAWYALRQQPHGDVLVGVVAAGFIAYAFFSAVEAVYRRG
jgi:hypothetical protein